jgi:hypothetical protein
MLVEIDGLSLAPTSANGRYRSADVTRQRQAVLRRE